MQKTPSSIVAELNEIKHIGQIMIILLNTLKFRLSPHLGPVILL